MIIIDWENYRTPVKINCYHLQSLNKKTGISEFFVVGLIKIVLSFYRHLFATKKARKIAVHVYV